jgi:hypothetical protein
VAADAHERDEAAALKGVMANQADVRRIAMALPGVSEGKDRFAFSVERKGKQKGFVWVWLERLAPKKARVPNPKVLAVRVADTDEKALLLEGDPDTFFTEPHYNGFPAVLVRLPAVTLAELRKLIVEAWRCVAPAALVLEGQRARPARSPRAKTSARASGGRSAPRSPGRTRR